MPACTILVVEDDKAIREVLVLILREENLTVVAARNGLAALAIIDRQPVDLVVLDMILPDASWPSMVDQIRATRPGARILAISASPELLAEATKVGVDAVLDKPFELEALLEVVTRLCPAEAKAGPFTPAPSRV
jgi:CheY-like chemotaxis protein